MPQDDEELDALGLPRLKNPLVNGELKSMEPIQPLQLRATKEAVAAVGGKPTKTLRAPLEVVPDSKRGQMIDDAEGQLEVEMGTLEEGTRARNKLYQSQLDAIRERQRKWEAKLKVEYEARMTAMRQAQRYAEHGMTTVYEEMEDKVSDMFDEYDNVRIPPLEKRCDVLEEGFEEFATVTVPGIIEELQGTVMRKLQRQREVFEIDNTKLDKREKKIIARFERHKEDTYQDFADEARTRHNKLLLMEEEMMETSRTDDRMEEQMHCRVILALGELKALLKEEATVREQEDLELLTNLAGSMQRLQQSILVNFGVSEGDQPQQA